MILWWPSFFFKALTQADIKTHPYIPEIIIMESKEGRLFQWFADGLVIPLWRNRRLIDGRYGLPSICGGLPSSDAVIQPDGTTSPLKLACFNGNLGYVRIQRLIGSLAMNKFVTTHIDFICFRYILYAREQEVWI